MVFMNNSSPFTFSEVTAGTNLISDCIIHERQPFRNLRSQFQMFWGEK